MYKLITINIEGDRHLEKVKAFLASESADIVCVQEIFDDRVSELSQTTYHATFVPSCLHNYYVEGDPARPSGTAILSKVPFYSVQNETLYAPTDALVQQRHDTHEDIRMTTRTMLQLATLDDEARTTIGNIHFTWSPHGTATETQRVDVETLIEVTRALPHFVLCGDFNIPRGNVRYDELTAHLTDHVPSQYAGSLDMSVHKSRHDPVEFKKVSGYMVDYIFSKPNTYTISEVTQHCGVSDHCAFSATLERRV